MTSTITESNLYHLFATPPRTRTRVGKWKGKHIEHLNTGLYLSTEARLHVLGEHDQGSSRQTYNETLCHNTSV